MGEPCREARVFESFNRVRSKQLRQRKNCSFYDGHFTNHDYELLKLCWAHDLVPMVIQLHLTHLMNPMDMRKGVISELKKRITSVLSSEMRSKVTGSRGGQTIDRISKKELAAQPMLQGEEFRKYDSQDFMRTAAVRAEAYNDRENRLKEFGERLDFGAHDQRLHPEDRAKMFADTLFNQAGRAGVLSNNANENNIARNREDNRRRFAQEPEDAFDASPGHPYRSLAFDTQFQDEKYQRNLEADLYRLNYNSSEDDDDYSSEDDDDCFSEDDDGLINENTSMSDMLLENEWDFEDDWNKGNDNDDDW